jgi:hypothetical protein
MFGNTVLQTCYCWKSDGMGTVLAGGPRELHEASVQPAFSNMMYSQKYKLVVPSFSVYLNLHL